MKRRRRPASIKRNLAIILGMMLICIALMLSVHWFNNPTPRLLDRDYDAINALRAAPENALHALTRAQNALPVFERRQGFITPQFYRASGRHSGMDAVAHSLLYAFAVQPIADEFRELFHQFDASVAEFRAAVAQPHFLASSPPRLPWAPAHIGHLYTLTNMTLYAAYMARMEHRTEDMVPLMMDIIRMWRKMVPEFIGWGQEVHYAKDPTYQVILMARGNVSPNALEALQEALEQLGPPYPDPVVMLEHVWEKFDLTFLYPEPIESMRFVTRMERRMLYRRLDRAVRTFAKDRDHWREWVRKTPSEIDKGMTKPLSRRISRYELPAYPWLMLLDLAERMAMETNIYHAARLAIALERFRHAQGQYPNQLAELVPDYIAELPADAVNGLPLAYRRHEDAYMLYSAGMDGVDNEARGRWEAVVTMTGRNVWLYEPLPQDLDILLIPYHPPAQTE